MRLRSIALRDAPPPLQKPRYTLEDVMPPPEGTAARERLVETLPAAVRPALASVWRERAAQAALLRSRSRRAQHWLSRENAMLRALLAGRSADSQLRQWREARGQITARAHRLREALEDAADAVSAHCRELGPGSEAAAAAAAAHAGLEGAVEAMPVLAPPCGGPGQDRVGDMLAPAAHARSVMRRLRRQVARAAHRPPPRAGWGTVAAGVRLEVEDSCRRTAWDRKQGELESRWRARCEAMATQWAADQDVWGRERSTLSAEVDRLESELRRLHRARHRSLGKASAVGGGDAQRAASPDDGASRARAEIAALAGADERPSEDDAAPTHGAQHSEGTEEQRAPPDDAGKSDDTPRRGSTAALRARFERPPAALLHPAQSSASPAVPGQSSGKVRALREAWQAAADARTTTEPSAPVAAPVTTQGSSDGDSGDDGSIEASARAGAHSPSASSASSSSSCAEPRLSDFTAVLGADGCAGTVGDEAKRLKRVLASEDDVVDTVCDPAKERSLFFV